MPYRRITSGTPSTPLSTNSGTIGNINDGDPSTSCEVQGAVSTFTFFQIDLGSPQNVDRVILRQWYETNTGGNPDTFDIRYSNSPINGGNPGSVYASSETKATTFPTKQDNTFTQTVVARYWALADSGDFHLNAVGMGDFDLYQNISGGFLFNLA